MFRASPRATLKKAPCPLPVRRDVSLVSLGRIAVSWTLEMPRCYLCIALRLPERESPKIYDFRLRAGPAEFQAAEGGEPVPVRR
jgi:hypothetical protein